MRAGSAWCLGALMTVGMLVRYMPGAWINPTMWEMGVFGLAAVWGVWLAGRPREAVWSGAMAAPLGAAAIGAIQLWSGTTVGRWETWNETLLWAANLAAFWVAAQIGGDAGVRRGMVRGLVAAGFGLAVVSVLQFYSAPGWVLWVYQTGISSFGPFVYKNLFAAFAELLLPAALVLAARRDGTRWFYTAAGATLFAATIAGGSKAGSALVVVEVLVMGVWALGRGKGRTGGGMARFAAVAAVFTAVVGVTTLADRIAGSRDTEGRLQFAESAVAMAKERPWTGFGLGNWENAYPLYARIDETNVVNHAHCDWAEWAMEGGLPMLVLMAGWGVWVVPRAWRTGWGMGVVSVMAHSLVDFGLHTPAMEFWVFAVGGVLAGARGFGED